MSSESFGTNPATERYNEVCGILGVEPSINFVRIHADGSIGFSCGKPDEVRWLLRQCKRKGLRPNKSLIEAATR
jgi:hypothetical protein